MAACTGHAHERRAQRGVKQVYIDLCLGHGTRSNVQNNDARAKQSLWLHKHYKNGLVVISVPNEAGPTVVTAYWTSTSETDIERCKLSFERLVARQKREKAKRAAKRAEEKKAPKKSGTKSTRARNVSVEVTSWDATPGL